MTSKNTASMTVSIALSVAMITGIVSLTGCGSIRTKEDEAKLTVANAFLNQENTIIESELDSGNYDRLLELILNRWEYSVDDFKSEIEQYSHLISPELKMSYINDVIYVEQRLEENTNDNGLDSGLEDYNNKIGFEGVVVEKEYEADPSNQDAWDSLSERDRLSNKVIGYWVNAIPNDAVESVLDAYDNNHLILNKQDGTYQIVENTVDIAGNPIGDNSDILGDTNLADDALGDTNLDSMGNLDDSQWEYDETRGEPEAVPYYRVMKKNVYHDHIVYTCSYNQSVYKYTLEIKDGIVVEVGGKFV